MVINADDTNSFFPSLSSMQRLAVSESGFVFDPASGHNFTVNETGLSILRLLQKTVELDPVLTNLVEEYDVSLLEAERDVLEFVGVLRSFVND